MDGAVVGAVVQGVGLGGVLAIAAAWSRCAREGPRPHLGIGGLAGVAVVLGARLPVPAPLALVLVVVAGAALTRLAHVLDGRVATHGAPGVLSDIAVLGGAVAIVGVLAPSGNAPTTSWPLGGSAGALGAGAALAVGIAGIAMLARPDVLPALPRWSIAGATLAGSAVLSAGVLADAAALSMAADPAGLGLRAAAAALAGRGSPTNAAVAGGGLGLAEALLRAVDPSGATALLPAVGVALLSVVTRGHMPTRSRPQGLS